MADKKCVHHSRTSNHFSFYMKNWRSISLFSFHVAFLSISYLCRVGNEVMPQKKMKPHRESLLPFTSIGCQKYR